MVKELKLKTILKNRLKSRVNLRYEKWFDLYKAKVGYHKHHLLESIIGGKRVNSFLLANKKPERHKDLHYKKQDISEDEFIDMFIEALESVFDYCEHLQKINDSK